MSDISKIKLASGKEYNIKDSYARELIGAHTHPIDTELDLLILYRIVLLLML